MFSARHLTTLSITLFTVGVALPQSNAVNAQQNNPYVAVAKSVYTQKLGDGTTISQETTLVEARDSAGREVHTTVTNSTGPSHLGQTTIVDPVTRTTTHWGNSTGQQAIRVHIPDPQQLQHRPSPTPAKPSSPNPTICTSHVPGPGVTIPDCHPANPPEFKVEKLGSKSLVGLYVEGTRTTRTIPIGQFGNDKPIVVIHEVWINPDLHLTVRRVDDDPRNGTLTIELISVDRREPDPVLFEIPHGYTVKDQYPGAN